MYLTEGDSWRHRPLHLEIPKYLREENVTGAAVFHCVAGFVGWPTADSHTNRVLSAIGCNSEGRECEAPCSQGELNEGHREGEWIVVGC